MIKSGSLYRKNFKGVYLHCLDQQQVKQVIAEFHGKHGIGHGLVDAMGHQIWRPGNYFPHVFQDAHQHVRTCHTYHTLASREHNPTMPLQLMYEVRHFSQWALDFVGVINQNSCIGHKFILTTTDYYTQWTKDQAYKNCTIDVVIKLLNDHVITKFGVTFTLVCDNNLAFSSTQFIQWAFEYKIVLKYSSNYYPQGNGIVESTNKNLLEVIKRLLECNPRDWYTQLKFSLWADRNCRTTILIPAKQHKQTHQMVKCKKEQGFPMKSIYKVQIRKSNEKYNEMTIKEIES